MRITQNYGDHKKEELLAEIEARGIEGFTMTTTKYDMIAALEMHDEENKEKPKTEDDPRDSEIAKLRAQVAEMEKARAASTIVPASSSLVGPPVVSDPTRFDLDTFKAGVFKDRESGEEFRLKIVEDADLGRTHQLANKEHFREMTEERFRATMEKV